MAHTEPDLLYTDIPIAGSCQKDTMLLLGHWSDLLGGGWAPLSTASPMPHVTSVRGFINSCLFLSFEAMPGGYLSLGDSSQQDADHWLCLWVRRFPVLKLASSSCFCPASPPCWALCRHQSLGTQSWGAYFSQNQLIAALAISLILNITTKIIPKNWLSSCDKTRRNEAGQVRLAPRCWELVQGGIPLQGARRGKMERNTFPGAPCLCAQHNFFSLSCCHRVPTEEPYQSIFKL